MARIVSLPYLIRAMYFVLYIVFVLFGVPARMAISISVHFNGELLPDIILLTQCYHHRGTRLNVMKRFCLCSLRSHQVYVLTFFFPPDWEMLRRS